MSISITYVETDISFWRPLTVILKMWGNPSYFPFKIVGFLEIKESGLRGSYFEYGVALMRRHRRVPRVNILESWRILLLYWYQDQNSLYSALYLCSWSTFISWETIEKYIGSPYIKIKLDLLL